jgi:DNA-directed RNA polymerase subunit H (RpoH/RPB5)
MVLFLNFKKKKIEYFQHNINIIFIYNKKNNKKKIIKMEEDDFDDATVAGATVDVDVDVDDEAGADEPVTLEQMDMFRAWKTCRQMVMERGYKIDGRLREEEEPTFEAFTRLEEIERNRLAQEAQEAADDEDESHSFMHCVRGVKDDGRKIVVKLVKQHGGAKITKRFLMDLRFDKDDNDEDGGDDGDNGSGESSSAAESSDSATTFIFVIVAKPTKTIICPSKYELFRYNEVIMNRTRHRLVPKHELMTKEEKKAVLEMYDCKESQIPRILKSDFMARYYGASTGDMFKIHRPSPSCGTYITYRMVK